jgi:dTDP-4-amino-4,6-dideoxygalactose transaminase
VHYEKPLSENTMYSTYKHRKDNCVNSKLVSDTILSLPIHAWLKTDEVNIIIAAVRNIL